MKRQFKIPSSWGAISENVEGGASQAPPPSTVRVNRFSEYCDYKQFLIYIYDPLIFDLMTLKFTQFIGSARCPELNSNPSVSSNENAFTSYFFIHNEPMTFDL